MGDWERDLINKIEAQIILFTIEKLFFWGMRNIDFFLMDRKKPVTKKWKAMIVGH